MPISCFTGKPGNGKTLTMMHHLAEDLLRTDRFIVTNIPVKLEELAEFLEKECDRRNLRAVKLHQRLLCIDTVEALMFWRFRPAGLVLPKWDGKSSEGKVLPEEELLVASKKYWQRIGKHKGGTQPVSYYISEAHRYYNSKRFQAISVIAELYATHHRHLHDEVYLDTQFPKQLCVAMRELIEEWHVLRNDYNRTVGFVKMIPRIRMSSYYEMPAGGTQKPFAKRNVYIKENGVAGCYESTGALGAIERTSDVEEKKVKRGVDMRLFVLGCVGAVVLLFGTLVFAPKFIFGNLFGGAALKQIDKNQEKGTNEPLQSNQGATTDHTLAELLQQIEEAKPLPTIDTLSIFTFRGRLYCKAVLSDGRTINQDSPGFEGANAEFRQIRLNGQVLTYQEAREEEPPVYAKEPPLGQGNFIGMVTN